MAGEDHLEEEWEWDNDEHLHHEHNHHDSPRNHVLHVDLCEKDGHGEDQHKHLDHEKLHHHNGRVITLQKMPKLRQYVPLSKRLVLSDVTSYSARSTLVRRVASSRCSSAPRLVSLSLLSVVSLFLSSFPDCSPLYGNLSDSRVLTSSLTLRNKSSTLTVSRDRFFQ